MNLSMKLSAVIAFPSTLGLFFLAEPIMKLIFFKNYQGIEILRYLSLSIPFIIITQTSTSVSASIKSLYKTCYKLIYRMLGKSASNVVFSTDT